MTVKEIRGFPAQEEALSLHRRLLQGDLVAPSDLAVTYLEPLARSLIASNSRAEEDDRFTAAEDALLSLIKNPAAYDSARATLDTYLRMAARRDLQNIQRSAYRHSSRRADWGAVELSPAQREHLLDDHADPAEIVEMNEMVEVLTRRWFALPASVAEGLSPQELAVVRLIQSGERRTDVYAETLGIMHLPPEERRDEVKRVKDRLKARIKRAGDDHG